MTNIDNLTEERIFKLTDDIILDIFKNNRKPELNNVIEGIRKESFQIFSTDEHSIEEYDLMLIVNYGVLEGYSLKSARKLKDRDLITYQFCRFLSENLPNQNEIILFNTFQNMLKSCYETFGILCIKEDEKSLFENSVVISKNKKSIENLLMINPINFFKSIFDEKGLIENKIGINKVYLMYDLQDNLFKIGYTSKTLEERVKGVSEATKRGKKPEIHIICAWNATRETEQKLQTEFIQFRKRGEWFDLTPRDLDRLKQSMKEHTIIKYNS
tara:strand:+ start:112 stop:924 length:813 start_codon:yes stop_codon:yes gene_type:complete